MPPSGSTLTAVFTPRLSEGGDVHRSLTRSLGLATVAAALLFVAACDEDASPAAPEATSVATAANGTQAVSTAQQNPPSSPDAGNPEQSATNLEDFEGAIINVVTAARPSVVQITNEQTLQSPFADPMTIPAGVGSGFIIDDQGHVLTNEHVIRGASRLIVSLADGRQLEAQVVGADRQTDLAVLLIEGEDVPVASIGRSSDLVVGQWVVAIGHALGLPGGPTVSTGVVSALDRTVQEPPDQGSGSFLFGVIQTDAPINPGNSGGPLVNLAGEVIGINTLVAGGPMGVAQGIGFAIAIDTAMPLADEMIATGEVVHPYMGISYVALNPSIVVQLNLPPGTTGAVIGGVVAGSPADEAGLQQFDVITAINGEPIRTESDLPAGIDALSPGDEVELEVLRNGETMTLRVTLGESPN